MSELGPVNGVLIYTQRLEPMLQFYRDVLGLVPLHLKERAVNFEWGGFRLTIGVHDRVLGHNTDPDRIMVNFHVDDIQAAYERLRAAGVHFTRQPEREKWGGWVATFQDPDGNTLQLLQAEGMRDEG